jgi:adenosylcobyric acid synthase
MFAAVVGTLAVLDPADRALFAGVIVNRFRGDPSLLTPGLDELGARTGLPTFGVLPFTDGIALDGEDSLDYHPARDTPAPLGDDVLRVAVVWFPRASNLTDLDPLCAEPGVIVRLVTHPAELADADLVVLPGTRATVADLEWLRARGFERVLRERAARALPILGLCGGYQMLGARIRDQVESAGAEVAGLALLAAETESFADKWLARPSATLADGTVVHGYEIRHGVTTMTGDEPFFADVGGRRGAVMGTSWHGLLENDSLRRQLLDEVAARTAKRFVASACRFAEVREARFERLADLLDAHLDVPALCELLGS